MQLYVSANYLSGDSLRFQFFVKMSTYEQTKEQAGQKAQETKGFGEEKAGQAQGAAKVGVWFEWIR